MKSKALPASPLQQGELALFDGFFSPTRNEESRTLEIFDSLSIYVYTKARRAGNLTPVTKTITVKRRDGQGGSEDLSIDVTVSAAVIKGQDGKGFAIYPGNREELVERAIRKLAVQQVVDTGLHTTPQSGVRIVRVSFTLYQLRKELKNQGHEFKVVELKEALEVLNKATINLSCARDRTIHGISSAVFSSYTYAYADDDEGGGSSKVSVDYHPLATQAIVNVAFFPYNYGRVMSLASPLARWLTTRMSHNFRQASKVGWLEGKGYHISLDRILTESGVARASRLRDNIASVREALDQMLKEKVLDYKRGPEEAVKHASTKGRKKVIDVVWTLFPSREFCEEIIQGNAEMLHWRSKQRSEAGPMGERKQLPGGPRAAEP